MIRFSSSELLVLFNVVVTGNTCIDILLARGLDLRIVVLIGIGSCVCPRFADFGGPRLWGAEWFLSSVLGYGIGGTTLQKWYGVWRMLLGLLCLGVQCFWDTVLARGDALGRVLGGTVLFGTVLAGMVPWVECLGYGAQDLLLVLNHAYVIMPI